MERLCLAKKASSALGVADYKSGLRCDLTGQSDEAFERGPCREVEEVVAAAEVVLMQSP